MFELLLTRKVLGIKQKDLAKKLGFSNAKLSLIENAKVRPKDEDLEKIRKFLKEIASGQTQSAQDS